MSGLFENLEKHIMECYDNFRFYVVNAHEYYVGNMVL